MKGLPYKVSKVNMTKWKENKTHTYKHIISYQSYVYNINDYRHFDWKFLKDMDILYNDVLFYLRKKLFNFIPYNALFKLALEWMAFHFHPSMLYRCLTTLPIMYLKIFHGFNYLIISLNVQFLSYLGCSLPFIISL